MHLRPLRWGLCLALLSCLWGFTMGGVFGAAEDSLKDALRANGEAVLAQAYGGDAEKMSSVVDKSFKYLIRSHLHGGAIGSVALLASLLLGSLRASALPLRQASSLLLGAGALLYSLYWAAAGWIAPSLGSTGAAKEALAFWAIPSAGACLLGLTLTLALCAREWWGQPET